MKAGKGKAEKGKGKGKTAKGKGLPPPPAPPAPPPASAQPAAHDAQPSSGGATLGGAGRTDPSWGYALTYGLAPGTFAATRAVCQALADAATQEHEPRTGVLTYAFACSCDDDDSEPGQQVHMLELFADSEAAASHLTENEGEAMVEMFQTSLQLAPSGATVVNVREDDMALQAALQFGSSRAALELESSDAEQRAAQRELGDQSTRFVWPAAGKVVDGAALVNKHFERYPGLRPPGDAALVLELRAEPETAEAAATTRDALCQLIGGHNQGMISCFVADGWWATAGPHAVGLLTLLGKPDHANAFFYRSTLAAALEAAGGGALTLAVTAQNWQAEALHELIEHFAESQIALTVRRRLFAGFLIHPAFCQPWHKRLAAEAAEKADAAAEAAMVGSSSLGSAAPAPSGTSGSGGGGGGGSHFSIRRHAVTDVAQAVVLAKTDALPPPPVPAASRDDELVVPLDHLLRKVCRLGRNDRELPIGMIFAQLNRLRGLLVRQHSLVSCRFHCHLFYMWPRRMRAG